MIFPVATMRSEDVYGKEREMERQFEWARWGRASRHIKAKWLPRMRQIQATGSFTTTHHSLAPMLSCTLSYGATAVKSLEVAGGLHEWQGNEPP